MYGIQDDFDESEYFPTDEELIEMEKFHLQMEKEIRDSPDYRAYQGRVAAADGEKF